MTRHQKLRYGLAAGLIIVGFACAAASTGKIGGALATVFVAGGLLAFLAFLFRDLGLTIDSKPRRPVPPVVDPPAAREDAPPGSPGPHGSPGSATEASRAPDGGRPPRATVRHPERLRGDRRRPR